MFGPGAIEPQGAVDALDIVGGGIGAKERLGRIAGDQLHHEEDDDREAENDRDRGKEAFGDVG
ncbi:hypothetical protein D3C85_1823550 [compost metagenome]